MKDIVRLKSYPNGIRIVIAEDALFGDVLAEAKQINEDRAAAEEVVEDTADEAAEETEETTDFKEETEETEEGSEE